MKICWRNVLIALATIVLVAVVGSLICKALEIHWAWNIIVGAAFGWKLADWAPAYRYEPRE